MNQIFVPGIDTKIVALKGCRKGFHGPWNFVRTNDGILRHVCNTCGYWEENGQPGKGIQMPNVVIEEWTRDMVARKLEAEIERQIEKFGTQGHSDHFWALIAGEEFGEVCKAIIEDSRGMDSMNTEKEVVQLTAVCLQWLWNRERRHYPTTLEVNNA